MNILIIGGLLGLAVLAILGAVLLGIGEDRSEKGKKVLQEQPAKVTAPLPPQAHTQQATSQIPDYPAVPATPLLPRPSVTLLTPSTDETVDSLSRADLHRQVREITSELRVLTQRVDEVQQRLTTLEETRENEEQSSHSNSSADFFTSDAETTQVF